MNWQKISDLPVVIKILRRAETEIREITGREVMLLISESEIAPEERKDILQDIICTYFNISWKRMISKPSTHQISLARQTYMYFAARMGNTYTEIARDCAARDHTAVTYAVKRIEGFYEVKDDFIRHLENIKSLIPKQILQ